MLNYLKAVVPREVPRWSQLRGFGTSRLVRSTILVPLIGYLILFSNDLTRYFYLVVDGDVADMTIVPPRLYFLYFGFCGLAIGSILFSWLCPPVVKSHGAAFEFVANEYDTMDNREQDRYVFALQALRGDTWKHPEGIFEVVRKGIMRDYFETIDREARTERVVITTFYVLGVALVAWPTAQTFWLVLTTAIAHL
jgi:hypothetical protein